MTSIVRIPPVLRGLVGGRHELKAEGSTLQELLQDMTRAHPQLLLHLFDEQGAVRRHILCIHESQAVRPRDFVTYQIEPGDSVIITNALAGG